MTDTEPTLRDALTAALAAHDCQGWGVDVPVPEHEFWDIWRESADVVLAVVQPDLDHLDFLRAAVDLIRRADISSEQILLCTSGDRITIAVNISDVFAWGSADAEDITPEGLPVLEQAWLDCKAVDAEEWTVELYAARVRGMRPQGAAYPKEAAVAALFDACGPEREVGLGNPHKAPAYDAPDGS